MTADDLLALLDRSAELVESAMESDRRLRAQVYPLISGYAQLSAMELELAQAKRLASEATA